MRTVTGFMLEQLSLAVQSNVAEKKELTLEVSAQNSSFYSPGRHPNPSHK